MHDAAIPTAKRFCLLMLLIAVGVGLAFAGTERKHSRERVVYAMGEDRIASGRRPSVDGPVRGDLILAGGEIAVRYDVGGDLVAAGGEVNINAATAQDLYAAGGRVSLAAPVWRNARVAAGKTDIGRQAIIGGNATLAGGNITVLGPVRGHLSVTGGRVYLNGLVEGNVDAKAGKIVLGPDARITGELRYRSSSALERIAGAEVQGAIVRLPGGGPWNDGANALRAAVVCLLLWTLGLMILGALLAAALPRLGATLENTARSRPAGSVLLGLAVLVATPIVAGVLCATGIGLPVGLLLFDAYLAVLLLGYVGAGIVLGRIGLRRIAPSRAERTGWRAVAAALAILLLSLAIAVPFLGWLVVFVLWLSGMGVLLLQLRRQTAEYNRSTPGKSS